MTLPPVGFPAAQDRDVEWLLAKAFEAEHSPRRFAEMDAAWYRLIASRLLASPEPRTQTAGIPDEESAAMLDNLTADELREMLRRLRGSAESGRPLPTWDYTVLLSALENWGRHFEWCASRQSTSERVVDCDCGLDKVLKESRARYRQPFEASSPPPQPPEPTKEPQVTPVDAGRDTVILDFLAERYELSIEREGESYRVDTDGVSAVAGSPRDALEAVIAAEVSDEAGESGWPVDG